ncbi:arylsulfatase [Oceaniferula spumae]
MRLLKNLFIFSLLASPLTAATKPNILFIFCDDLGYGDLGVFNQKQREKANEADKPWFTTPHIDQLAAEGMQLRAHYCAAPVCAPSRASLFLGQHQGNAPIRDNQFDKALPDQPTLASTLKQAGYHTALIGKWGLQGNGSDSKSWPSYPTKRGFDYFLGGVRHVDGHEHYPFDKIHVKKKKKNIKHVEIWEQDKEIGGDLKGCYTTDLFTAASKKWLINHHRTSPEKPFFLFLSYDTPHAATQIATSPYPKGFGVKGGIQWLGKSGKMINTANDSPDVYLHPDYADRTYDHDNNPSTPLVPWTNVAKRYASSIRRIDNAVADVIQTLKDLGVDNNTVIIFSSDHGPSKESYISEPLQPGFFDSFGPFTGIKRDCWEGGIRPGALARWPGVIKAGSITDSPSQMNDWMPTFCDIAKAPTPALSDGVSLLPTLTGKGSQAPSSIYVEYHERGTTPGYPEFPESRRKAKRNQMQVVREGNLKAIRYNIKNAKDPFMVFDVVKDPSETTDLAGQKGIPSQDHWHAAAARLHGSNSSAKRPYDNVAIPALTPENPTPGIIRRAEEGATPYATRIADTAASETVKALSTKAIKGNTQLSGYIKVDQGGRYQFSFQPNTKAVLYIHGILVLDSDSSQSSHSKKTLNLKPGYHPFDLNVRTSGQAASSVLLWKKADSEKQAAAPAETALFH